MKGSMSKVAKSFICRGCLNPVTSVGCTTRWTSAYEMIKCLLLLKDAIHNVLSNSDKCNVRDLDLSAENLFELREWNRNKSMRLDCPVCTLH